MNSRQERLFIVRRDSQLLGSQNGKTGALRDHDYLLKPGRMTATNRDGTDQQATRSGMPYAPVAGATASSQTAEGRQLGVLRFSAPSLPSRRSVAR